MAFENIYASIRYYSRKSVLTMAEAMRAKWAQNKNPSMNKRFIKFKHVSALMIHLFTILAVNAKKITNK